MVSTFFLVNKLFQILVIAVRILLPVEVDKGFLVESKKKYLSVINLIATLKYLFLMFL